MAQESLIATDAHCSTIGVHRYQFIVVLLDAWPLVATAHAARAGVDVHAAHVEDLAGMARLHRAFDEMVHQFG